MVNPQWWMTGWIRAIKRRVATGWSEQPTARKARLLRGWRLALRGAADGESRKLYE